MTASSVKVAAIIDSDLKGYSITNMCPVYNVSRRSARETRLIQARSLDGRLV